MGFPLTSIKILFFGAAETEKEALTKLVISNKQQINLYRKACFSIYQTLNNKLTAQIFINLCALTLVYQNFIKTEKEPITFSNNY